MNLRGLLAAILVCAMAWPAAAADYNDPDGGWVVLSVTTGLTNPLSTDVVLKFNRVGLRTGDFVEKSAPLSLFNSKADEFASGFGANIEQIIARKSMILMKNRTKTDVFVVRLPPGPYQIYDIGVAASLGNMHYWANLDDAPIQFTINPGRTTYLGSFTPAPVGGPGLFGLPRFAKWIFLMTDQSERDLPIAQARVAGLPPAEKRLAAVPASPTTAVEAPQGHDVNRF
jgi:hypothetical protein